MNRITKTEHIENRIYTIRGLRIMLDSDLAALYEVETKVLNQAVKRNIDKFPLSFMFQLKPNEWENLRSQFVTFRNDIRKFKPYVFTEHGVLMLANVLHTKKATTISIKIIEAFVKLQNYSLTHVELNEQVAELRKLLMLHIENTDGKISEHDQAISQIIVALNNLIGNPKPAKRIGFNTD